VAQLRSDAQPKHIIVQVKIGKVTVTKPVEFIAVTAAPVFTLTADPQLKANGFFGARIGRRPDAGRTRGNSATSCSRRHWRHAHRWRNERFARRGRRQRAGYRERLPGERPHASTDGRHGNRARPLAVHHGAVQKAAASELITIRTSAVDGGSRRRRVVRVTAVCATRLTLAKRRVTLRTREVSSRMARAALRIPPP